jgi:hypothetical protein
MSHRCATAAAAAQLKLSTAAAECERFHHVACGSRLAAGNRGNDRNLHAVRQRRRQSA